MGYTTDFFNSKMTLNKRLSADDQKFLTKLNETRRMGRNVEGYGVEGEFYVDGGDYGDENIIDGNTPPKTQPGLWCGWRPTEDGMGIEWDGGEKFYRYVEWLEYIIEWLKPRDYVLNGSVDWCGEEQGDTGTIVVVDNVVATRAQGVDGENATRVFFVVDSPADNEEIFETLEQAETHMELSRLSYEDEPRIRICIVRNAYREDNGSWNYDDQANTFEFVKEIK